VAGAAPPQAVIASIERRTQIFTPLSVDDVAPFVKGANALGRYAFERGAQRRKCSPRRPRHGATTEHVNVDVENALPCVCAIVDDRAPTQVRDLGFARHALGGEKQLTEQLGIAGDRLVQRDQMSSRDDEGVCRGSRMNVGKRDQIIVFEENLGGNFLFGDLTEKAHHESPEVVDG
jgi:hypothetical protein